MISKASQCQRRHVESITSFLFPGRRYTEDFLPLIVTKWKPPSEIKQKPQETVAFFQLTVRNWYNDLQSPLINVKTRIQSRSLTFTPHRASQIRPNYSTKPQKRLITLNPRIAAQQTSLSVTAAVITHKFPSL